HDGDMDLFSALYSIASNPPTSFIVSNNQLLDVPNNIVNENFLNARFFSAREMLPVDMDNDLDTDILFYNPDFPNIAWFENTNDFEVTHHLIHSTNAPFVHDLRTGDLDSDGDNDFIYIIDA